MSWSPKRRDSETLATVWTLRLSTCMASKQNTIYIHTHTQTLFILLFLTHNNIIVSVVYVSDHTPNTLHIPFIQYIFIYIKQNKQNNNNNNTAQLLLTPSIRNTFFVTQNL